MMLLMLLMLLMMMLLLLLILIIMVMMLMMIISIFISLLSLLSFFFIIVFYYCCCSFHLFSMQQNVSCRAEEMVSPRSINSKKNTLSSYANKHFAWGVRASNAKKLKKLCSAQKVWCLHTERGSHLEVLCGWGEMHRALHSRIDEAPFVFCSILFLHKFLIVATESTKRASPRA